MPDRARKRPPEVDVPWNVLLLPSLLRLAQGSAGAASKPVGGSPKKLA
jgi:hypothetical protein